MKKKYIYLGIGIIVIAFLAYRFSSSINEKKDAPTENRSASSLQVSGVVAKSSRFSNELTVSGSIEANEQVQLRSEVSGIIRQLYFQEGTYVQEGQVLFTIDDTELQAQLIQRRTEEKLAEDNSQRATLLFEKEAISSQEKDVALADLESAKAQTQLIKAQIAKTKITAPFSGKIGLRSVSKGEYLTPTTVVATLMNTNPVKILFSVPEKYSSQVKIGHPLSFTTSSSQQKFDAKIYAIEPGIDAETRTVQIRAIAQNPNGALMPGAFARVQLPINMVENAILVPTEAIIPIQNGQQVFVAKNGKAKSLEVQTAGRTSTDVLVTTGVGVGDTVLTSGIMSLKDGSPIQVKLTSN
ncbi:efflux RND transporter periplasmic adaptor subunit [Olivibacter sitiensis]|uniref:efflux RND transporter periplasmic adaptor subunit n=1 Tax=Olivibacter sitiensis TaxID=376470 RepID=UPI00040BDE73|nr:efflux RND transporter periplasmic adaptor subunit [Olivibacter sitiensis]